MKVWRLQNPRVFVKSACITFVASYPEGSQWVLSVITKYDWMGVIDSCSSLTAAKRLFSTHFLSPKDHGPNI